jgi:hypothetical protein
MAPDYTLRDYNPKLRLDYVAPPSIGVGVGGFGGTQVGGGVAASFSDQLGNRNVTAVLQAQGDIKDIGGQLFYQNTQRRWNWGVGVGHIPYLTGYSSVSNVSAGGFIGQQVDTYLQRVFVDQASFITQYPLSTTRRIEVGVSGTRLAYNTEIRSVLYVGNQGQDLGREELPSPEPVYYAQANAALVGDYSNSGFTSPIAGGRYRLEVTPTVGTLNFSSMLADYRRYFFARPFTFAIRGLHFGRYGRSAEDSTRLSPLFLGYETLVRGYAVESFDASECTGTGSTNGTCPEFDRLRGSRLAVASAEFRIPLLGTEQLGLIRTRLIPVEIAPFFDAGLAWSSNESPELQIATRTTQRVPVFSAGVSARINVLGFAVFEAYYAYPFQRPDKGAHFGFNLAPGW